jgi:hypothetical protein
MDETERLAHMLQLVTGDRLSLAVTDNHPTTRREREGMDWYNAHEAV